MSELSTLIHKLDRLFGRQIDARLAPLGTTRAQFDFLAALAGRADSPMAIAQATGRDPATITGLAKTLAAAQVIERQNRLGDLRGVRFLFTKKGKKLYEKSSPLVRDYQGRLAAALDSQQKQTLEKWLIDILNNVVQ